MLTSVSHSTFLICLVDSGLPAIWRTLLKKKKKYIYKLNLLYFIVSHSDLLSSWPVGHNTTGCSVGLLQDLPNISMMCSVLRASTAWICRSRALP